MRTLHIIGKAGMLIALVTMLGLVLAVGCEETTPEEAENQLCQDLTAFAATLAPLANVGPTTTVDELDAMKSDIKAAFEDVKQSAAQVAAVNIDELEQAEADLEAAIDEIPGDATIQEALGMIESEFTQVVLAWEQLEAGAGCGGPAGSPAPSPTM